MRPNVETNLQHIYIKNFAITSNYTTIKFFTYFELLCIWIYN
ncbi:protein of unknown function [Clostridium beijerinckii]|nr:protein of unknown function [Clostridium beijerinckii]